MYPQPDRALELNAPFEIDLHSGTLSFPQLQLTLKPKQSRETFLTTGIAKLAEDGGSSDGRQRYHLKRHPLSDGHLLGVSLCFLHDGLTEVRFDFRPASEADWSTWSKEQEMRRTEVFRSEIVRQLGRRGTFPWGMADAGYDDKAASAVLFVKYSSSTSAPEQGCVM